jgi:hypothetical protein
MSWRPAVHDDPTPEPERRLASGESIALLAAGAALVSGVLVAGAAGVLVVATALAAIAGLVFALRTPEAPRRRRRARPGPEVGDASFRAFREVAEQLSWGAVSRRHYDLTTKPLFVEIAAARLAERHRVDLYVSPERAAELVGPEVWALIDPRQPPSRNSQPPGVPRGALALVVDRLERL